MVLEFNAFLEQARAYLPADKIPVLEEAYRYAAEKHEGQVRLSGEPFLEHPLQTAVILAELQMDASTLAAALLHDIPEDTGVPLEEIKEKFGEEIAALVDGVTKLGKVSLTTSGAAPSTTQAENLRKMLVAMAEDLRVVFIKLADRLHNMRTLDALPPDRQLVNAQETMDIYAPLAHRLGIWELKWQLEDLSFQYLNPKEYQTIARLINVRRNQREKFIARAIGRLQEEFEKMGLAAEITGRAKHIYSIYQKKERYAAAGRHFDEIYDLLALRVHVNTVPECYTAVGIIHSIWHPLPEAFDDYIGNSKPNGYQAIHTAVRAFGTTPIEVQIRTWEMHRIAEYGVAAHWRYKQGQSADMKFEERVAWLRQLIDWHRELSGAEEFLESVKTDIFIDQVFVYTPRGEIKDLPRGATPLDFAYRVHTDLGNRCVGAKVNGKLVPFNYELKNGDVVEIIAAKGSRGPSLDWLNPNLGYVKTTHAKTKIRQWFNKQEREENIERGRQILEKELKRLGLQTERQVLSELFGYTNLDDFLVALGNGTITSNQIITKVASQVRDEDDITAVVSPSRAGGTGVRVLGVGDLMVNIAQCCHPVPGDAIIGYITRSRGVTVHRADCPNVLKEEEKERLIPVEWGRDNEVYQVRVVVEAHDRVGLMRDVTTAVADEKVNITSLNMADGNGQEVALHLTIEITGLTQLSQVLKKVDGIKGVVSVSRVGDEKKKKKAARTEPQPTAKDAGAAKK
jgi:guanosine-3',5'-bis(diphosphate) 3'-pyrophosphohydrolase